MRALSLTALLSGTILAADYDPAPLQAKLADAGDKAAALVIEEVRAHPKELALIVRAAVASAPKQALMIVKEVLQAFPKEFTAIVTAAILGQPDLTKEITEAALKSLPEKAAEILKAAENVPATELPAEPAGAPASVPSASSPGQAPNTFPVQPVRPDTVSPSQ